MLLPDIVCRGAEKSFVDFAERVTKEWADEDKRVLYGDDWFRCAVARIIPFRAAERLVSEAPWYEGGYRAQIVAYTLARLAHLVQERSKRGSLDYTRIWSVQAAGEVLERQMLVIGEVMASVLRNPPQAGQNISEWAKQQACRKRALETEVPILRVFDGLLLDKDDVRSERKDARADGRVDRALEYIAEVMNRGPQHWQRVRDHARINRLLLPGDEKALAPALNLPKMVPSDRIPPVRTVSR